MKKISLGSMVFDLLKDQPEKQLTARQIAKQVFAVYPAYCMAKREASTHLETENDVITQLAAEIGAHRPALQIKHPQIKTTAGRPKKYYYTEKTEEAEIEAAEEQSVVCNGKSAELLSEQALYPLLTNYLRNELNVFSLRIDEKKSSNKKGKNGNKWLHPDLVGLEDIGAHWEHTVKECIAYYGDKRTRLWSFEVKKTVNMSNVREAFFQAVSNSSWANLGYLVAMKIDGGETMREMRMLNAAHGIGVIQLDTLNVSESQILIPAREKELVDWNSCHRLVQENPDFKRYIELVKQFYQVKEIKPYDWDR